MVREKNVEKFHKYFVDLWTFLKKIYNDDSSEKDYLNKIYMKHHRMDKVTYLEQVLTNISPYIDYISKKDEFIFMPEFGKKPLHFLLDYNFKIVWKNKNLTSEHKRIIFRYLEFLYIQASLALNKNLDKVNLLVEAIKTEQEIEKAAIADPNMFGDAQASGNMDFKSLFGDDNVLVDLAQDISQEFDLQSTLNNILGGANGIKPGQNPMDAIKNIVDNPELKNMMEKMTKRVTEKMKEKNITQDDILKSTETLKDNLTANISKMPGGSHLRRMINNFDFEQLATQFANNQQQQNNTAINVENNIDPNLLMQQMLNNFTNAQNVAQNTPNVASNVVSNVAPTSTNSEQVTTTRPSNNAEVTDMTNQLFQMMESLKKQ